jgi:hypothetical protein
MEQHCAIPPPPPLLDPRVGMVFTGIIPFAAAYVELFFIMTSLWMDQFYYVFGFTLIVYLILIVTCAEVTVLLVYYQLCAENHRWWWYSFLCSGSVALYTLVYSIFPHAPKSFPFRTFKGQDKESYVLASHVTKETLICLSRSEGMAIVLCC